MVGLILAVLVWILAMEMNSNQDVIWSDPRLTQKERDNLHRWDAIQVASLGIAMAFLYSGISIESFLLGLFFFFARCGYFSWRLNHKREKEWYHLGKGWWDSMFNRSPKLYFITCFLGMFSTLLWLLKEYVQM